MTANSQVSWVIGFAPKEGKAADLEALMDEMVESTHGESGTLMYEWLTDEDGSTVHVYERYADSEATLAHLRVFGERFAARFLDAVEPIEFTVYGSPNDQVREALAAFGPTYMGPFGGFVREFRGGLKLASVFVALLFERRKGLSG